MKSILNYSQPDFYSFTEESLQLIEFAKELLPQRTEFSSALDLCAGCGVIGLEAKLKIPTIKKMTFLELQKEFISSLKENIAAMKCEDYEIVQKSLGEELFLEGSFDLIFSNPPYFSPEQGRPSPNRNRQVCRAFEVDGRELFFSQVRKWLKKDAFFFFTTKELEPILSLLSDFTIVEKKETKAAWLFCVS